MAGSDNEAVIHTHHFVEVHLMPACHFPRPSWAPINAHAEYVYGPLPVSFCTLRGWL
jgi:hypothetical protein